MADARDDHPDEPDDDDLGTSDDVPRPDAPDVADLVDLSILRLPLFWDQPDEIAEPLFLWHYRGPSTAAKSTFWRAYHRRRRDVPIRGTWLNQNPFVRTLADLAPVGREFMILSDERIDELQSLQTVNIDTRNVIVPWSVSEQLAEQVPQFTLRNIARLERDDAVERGIRLEHEPGALAEANEQLEALRNPYVEPVELPESWSAPLFEDFRTFLEEVLFLCPWGQMPTERKIPPEDSLWHPDQSRAKLTRELLDLRDRIFVFGQRGAPQAFLRERKERVFTAKQPAAQPVAPPPAVPPPAPGSDPGGERMG